MRCHSTFLVSVLLTFTSTNAVDSKRALMETPDLRSTRLHMSDVDELLKRNLRKVTTIDEVDSEDEERGPGTSVSAIESIAAKSDDVWKIIAAGKAEDAAKAAEAIQIKEWLVASKPVDDIFKLLKLDQAGDDLFKHPKLVQWIKYADDADKRVSAQTSSAISVLQTKYADEKLLGMLIKNEMYGPTSTVRLLSQDKTYSLLNKWAADKQSVDQVTVWLRSVGSKQQVPRKTIDGLVGKYKNIVSTPIKKSRLGEYDELYNDVLKEVNARKIYMAKLVKQGKSVAYVEREISELTTHLAKLQNLKIAEKRSPSKNLIGTPVRKSRLSELEELHADVIKEVNAKKDYMTKLTTLGKPEKAASVNDEISTLTDHLKSIGSAIEKEKISPSS